MPIDGGARMLRKNHNIVKTIHLVSNRLGNKDYSCSFLGYQPPKESANHRYIKKVKKVLEKIVDHLAIQYEVSNYYICMNQGVSLWAAESVHDLCSQYVFNLTAVLPYPDHEKKWTEAERREYHYILKRCNTRELVHKEKCKCSYLECNEYIVKRTKYVVAFFDETIPDENKQAIEFAAERGCKVILINPRTLCVSGFLENEI